MSCRDKTKVCLSHTCLRRQTFCLDKHTFVETKDVFCRDKHVFVATKVYLSRQNVCRDKQNCVATNICRDKRFVATKIFCCDKQYFRDKTFVTTIILLLRQKTCLSRKRKRQKKKKKKKKDAKDRPCTFLCPLSDISPWTPESRNSRQPANTQRLPCFQLEHCLQHSHGLSHLPRGPDWGQRRHAGQVASCC